MFGIMSRDKLYLLKTDGSVFENIAGTVSSSTLIILPAKDLSIEVDDILQRTLPNGVVETYKVLDPVYYNGTRGIPSNYQLKVRNLAVADANKAIHNITVNQSGHNSRVNVNSTDNSTNTVTISNEFDQYLSQLRSELSRADLTADQREGAHDVVEVIESQVQSGKPKPTVISALVASLPSIASIATIGEKIVEAVVKLHS